MATVKNSPGKSQASGAKGAGAPAPKPTAKPSCSVCGQAHEGTKHGGR